MSTLAWIVVLGVAMSAIAMVSSVTLVLPEAALDRLIVPLVALAAGSLLGGAFLHMLPNAIDELGNRQAVWIWFLGGFAGFSRGMDAGWSVRAVSAGQTRNVA